jgi:hypothetical protein
MILENINLMIGIQNLYLTSNIDDKIHDSWLILGILFFELIIYTLMHQSLEMSGTTPLLMKIAGIMIPVTIILMVYYAFNSYKAIDTKTKNLEKNNKKIEVSYDNSKSSTDLVKFDIEDFQIKTL